MADVPSWPWAQPPSKPSKPSKPIGTLEVILIAFGIGVVGAYALDLHAHVCAKCGRKWRHLGAFNLGDERAHSCPSCGTIQWWKDGVAHAWRDGKVAEPPPPPPPLHGLPAPREQLRGLPAPREAREPSPGALPSGTALEVRRR